MFPIPIFIGMSEKFEVLRGLTEYSILQNTTSECDIKYVRPVVEEGCTGFSNVRYAIRHGIYLDPDMIVLGDIAELWGYKKPGQYVCLKDGSTEVAVIDCEHQCRNKFEQHKLKKLPIIPLEWNVEDKIIPGMKLLHFTNMHTQPWFNDHPDKEAVAIYERYRDGYKEVSEGVDRGTTRDTLRPRVKTRKHRKAKGVDTGTD